VISNGLNPDVPVWDASTQTISVQVSGPHYKINGELNAGFFQARISKEIAKCLWNLDVSSATKAQITLTDQGTGGTQVIVCPKGMKRLKLSGIKPMCPKGFVLTK
jgi:hypothetical protein